MVLVYLPTKLGDFGQGQMLETLPAPWVMAHLHYCHFHIAIGSIIGEFSWKVIMFAPEMRRVSLSLSPKVSMQKYESDTPIRHNPYSTEMDIDIVYVTHV